MALELIMCVKKLTYILILAVFLTATFVFAQDNEASKNPLFGDIKKDAEKIVEFKDINSAINIRKQIISKILDFTNLEIADLKGGISAVKDLEKDEMFLQSQFLSKLASLGVQIGSFKDVLRNLRTLEETKALASSFNGWRGRYLGETKKIKDWILYYKIANFWQVANIRASSIEKEINSFAVESKDYDQIRAVVEKSKKNLEDAVVPLDSAKKILIDFYLDRDFNKISLDKFIEPRSLVLQALNSIKNVYLAFLEISLSLVR